MDGQWVFGTKPLGNQWRGDPAAGRKCSVGFMVVFEDYLQTLVRLQVFGVRKMVGDGSGTLTVDSYWSVSLIVSVECAMLTNQTPRNKRDLSLS